MLFKVNESDAYAATGKREPDPARDTVVFIHGTAQDHTLWTLPTRYFARHGKNVLAVDLPGHGRSAGAPLETIEDIADWIIALLDAAGIEQAALVGHSMGSLVCIAAAARHPGRVRAIALVAVSVPMPVADYLLGKAADNDHEAIDMLNFWGFSKSAQIGGNATPGNWMLGGGMRLMERAGPGVIHADLNACNAYVAGLKDAESVDCPALLILGERDRLTPARAAGKVAESLPRAETVILPGAGHALLSEQPDPVLDQLIRVV
jgi:pimeloyl-ACP methyl ester carboxylesterase